MRRVTQLLVLTIACSGIWVSAAQAQTCMGQAPNDVNGLKVGGQFNFADGTHGVSGGVAKQFNSFFAGGGVMLEGVSGINTAKGFYASAGTERAVDSNKKYFVCPLVQWFGLWGLHPAPNVDTSTMIFSFGGQFGFEAAKSGTTRIVPTAGFSINIARQKWSGGGFDFTNNETVASLNGGVGLIFNEKSSLVPMIILDLNADELEPTFAVIFSMKLNKK